jgi:hypothetical protein
MKRRKIDIGTKYLRAVNLTAQAMFPEQIRRNGPAIWVPQEYDDLAAEFMNKAAAAVVRRDGISEDAASEQVTLTLLRSDDREQTVRDYRELMIDMNIPLPERRF